MCRSTRTPALYELGAAYYRNASPYGTGRLSKSLTFQPDKVTVCVPAGDKSWSSTLEECDEGVVRSPWVDNFQVSDDLVRWKGLTTSMAYGWNQRENTVRGGSAS